MLDLIGGKRQKGWQAFAKIVEGEFLPDNMMVRYTHQKWNVVLELYEEERNGGLSQYNNTSFNQTRKYTQFRAYVVNQEGLFFQARPKRFLVDTLYGWLGAKSIKFRDPDFKKYVHLTASDQVLAREVFLEPDLQRMLLRQSRYTLFMEPLQESREKWAFGDSGAKLIFRVRETVYNQHALEKMHLMFIKMLDRLAETGMIGPKRPVPRVAKKRR